MNHSHWRIGKRNTIQVAEVPGSYEVDWNSLDDLIDAGVTQEPIRGFPRQWTGEAVGLARAAYLERAITELRACEVAISTVYERHKYAASWNAPLFPERDILAKAGKLKRDNARTKKRKQRERSSDQRDHTAQAQPTPSSYAAA